MSAAMVTEPRAVVAHSLGTVVAYDWLRSNPNMSATSLITLGSPLGFRGIRKLLHAGPDRSPAPWPNGVTTWLNVAAKKDPVALVKMLDGMFAGAIDDESAANPRSAAHDAVEYLQNVHTAKALAKTLG
jgi:pimeloyl-ACP methyl ester carboxylesterase